MRSKAIVMRSLTTRIPTACGPLYSTLTFSAEGKFVGVLPRLGKSGTCPACTMMGLACAATEALRGGVPARVLVKGLRGMACGAQGRDGVTTSCVDALAEAMERGALAEEAGEFTSPPVADEEKSPEKSD